MKIFGVDIFTDGGIITIVTMKEDSKMSKINPIALELRSGKYKQRVIKNKKKYDRKRMKQERE